MLSQCLSNVLSWDADTVKQLQLVDCISPMTCNVEDLLIYCANWCCLSDWLSRTRPKSIPKPMRFVVGEYETDSYWFNLVFYSHRLGKLAMNKVAAELELNRKTNKGALSNSDLSVTTLVKMVKLCCSVVGVLHYATTRALRASLWVEKIMPLESEEMMQFYYVLRTLVTWMTCRIDTKDWQNHAKWARSTNQLIQSHSLHKYEMLQAIRNDCDIQLWLAKANCVLSKTANESLALSCYEQAQELGWNFDAHATTLEEDCDTLDLPLPESLDDLDSTCALPDGIVDPVVKGTNPLHTFTFKPPVQTLISTK